MQLLEALFGREEAVQLVVSGLEVPKVVFGQAPYVRGASVLRKAADQASSTGCELLAVVPVEAADPKGLEHSSKLDSPTAEWVVELVVAASEESHGLERPDLEQSSFGVELVLVELPYLEAAVHPDVVQGSGRWTPVRDLGELATTPGERPGTAQPVSPSAIAHWKRPSPLLVAPTSS